MTAPIQQIYLGQGSFNPLINLTGVIGWWDASVTASLNLTGTNINSVADQSGNGQTMTKAGSSNFPQYNATGFNTSYPSMLFTATDIAVLEAGSFIMGAGNTLTFWYVGTCSLGTSSAFGRAVSYDKPGSTDDGNNVGSWTFYRKNSATALGFTRNAIEVSKSGLSAQPAGHRIIGTIDSSGVMTLYVDGVASSTATSSGNWVSVGTLAIGRRAATGFDYGSFIIPEVGVATGFTNSTTVAALDTYLKTKWGL